MEIVDSQRKQFDALNEKYFEFLEEIARYNGKDPDKMSKQELSMEYTEMVKFMYKIDCTAYANIARELIKRGIIEA